MSAESSSSARDLSSFGSLSYVEAFVGSLNAAGYPRRTLNKKRFVATRFLEWLQGMGISVLDANEAHMASFLGRLQPEERERLQLEHAAIRGLLRHLSDIAAAPSVADGGPQSPSIALLGRYTAYLRNSRGLSPRSIQVYLPLVQKFIEAWESAAGSMSNAELSGPAVRALLLDRI